MLLHILGCMNESKKGISRYPLGEVVVTLEKMRFFKRKSGDHCR